MIKSLPKYLVSLDGATPREKRLIGALTIAWEALEKADKKSWQDPWTNNVIKEAMRQIEELGSSSNPKDSIDALGGDTTKGSIEELGGDK